VRPACAARAAAAIAVLACAGCGFHPLYAPGGSTQAGLREVFVDVIPNRNGQLLRQALQRRLEGSEGGGNEHFELSVSLSLSTDAVGIQGDNTSSRTRYLGTAHWTLHKPGAFGSKMAAGIVRSLDGANVIDEQFFYSDLSSEAIQRRMGENLADQIVQALAAYFRAHPGEA
jgi:LPS-assembly lipoprotein